MMEEMTIAQVHTLLEMQGFAVLEEDLPEITARLNALVFGLTALSDQVETEVETWPTAVPWRDDSKEER